MYHCIAWLVTSSPILLYIFVSSRVIQRVCAGPLFVPVSITCFATYHFHELTWKSALPSQFDGTLHAHVSESNNDLLTGKQHRMYLHMHGDRNSLSHIDTECRIPCSEIIPL